MRMLEERGDAPVVPSPHEAIVGEVNRKPVGETTDTFRVQDRANRLLAPIAVGAEGGVQLAYRLAETGRDRLRRDAAQLG